MNGGELALLGRTAVHLQPSQVAHRARAASAAGRAQPLAAATVAPVLTCRIDSGLPVRVSTCWRQASRGRTE